MLKENTKRIEWIDLVKFIAIFYMVWAHCGAPGIIYWYIQSFHMPLFFFSNSVASSRQAPPRSKILQVQT